MGRGKSMGVSPYGIRGKTRCRFSAENVKLQEIFIASARWHKPYDKQLVVQALNLMAFIEIRLR